MGWWQVNADTLAGSRFVVSPLAEATASLKTLERGTAAYPAERAWLDAHLPAYRDRLADDPVTGLLIKAAFGSSWNATFLTPTPAGDGADAFAGDGGRAFAGELARVRRTPPETVHADLAEALGGPLPAVLDRPDLAERAADLLEWVWTRAVLPDWTRRRGVIEADVLARTARLGQDGWAAALDGMRPGMRWLGGGRLQITAHDHPPRELSGARLLFVPVTPRQSWLAWDAAHRSAVVYPCSGPLAEAGRTPVPEALGTLLGPGRAAVLTLLDAPKSTTQLVALTGQGLGSVGRHLKVLRDGNLVQRRRAGRSVLYYRTLAGEVLVTAQRHG
ncbi:ArsR/SmtB family transcription factor [Actinomadura xylanilytica]|uniref:ArsR/SmtB family transcription factor n=1 Tax=Actinomadura xylanilytica TaxID=887459 RepID=UPI00255AB0F0|nr:winged helix-turn-helix domain-containing protein [Actinomadura xylanilytica]MDL4775559.1 winged helix-turn-helix domain-containing protein [Actinomadura xylanilytica]